MPMEWLMVLDHPSTKDKAGMLLKLKYEMTVEDVHDLTEYQKWLDFQSYDQYLNEQKK